MFLFKTNRNDIMPIDPSQARNVAQRYNDLMLHEPYRVSEIADEALAHTARETGASEATIQDVSRMELEDMNEAQKQIFVTFYTFLSEHGI